MQKRLERSATDRVFSGVCGGLAQYFSIDPTFVRAFFVIGSLLTAFLLTIVYIVLIVVMPLPGQPAVIGDLGTGVADERRGALVAYVLIGLGLVFLLGNFGLFSVLQWKVLWPLVLVGLGVLLLFQRSRS
ncbi:MAG: PspC domain-containing protein [Chloroflexi bacterium]|nr:PspC domain-containing protein [Chloroflexota bacterium]